MATLPVRRRSSPSLLGARPGAPLAPPVASSTSHIMLRKSHGFSCSRSSYSREIGRIACSATMCDRLRACVLSCRTARSRSWHRRLPSDDGQAVEGREAARVAQPAARPGGRGCSRGRRAPARALSVTLSTMLGGVVLGEVALARSPARPGRASRPPPRPAARMASISIAMSASMKAIACFFAIGDAEGLALLGVVARVVERRARDADRQRRTARRARRVDERLEVGARRRRGARSPARARPRGGARGRERLDAHVCARARP